MSNKTAEANSSLPTESGQPEYVPDAEWVSAFEFMGTCPFCSRTRTFQFDGDLLLYRCVVCGSSMVKNRINPGRPFMSREETVDKLREFSPLAGPERLH